MTLYKKIQEFNTLLENAKNDNSQTLEYAKNELKSYAKQELKDGKDILSQELKELLRQGEQSIEQNLSTQLLGLFTTNKDALIESIKKSLDIAELENSLKDKIVFDNITLLTSSFKQYLNENCEHIAQEQREELLKALKEHTSTIIKGQSELIVQEVVKELDFSFLQNQPQVFYDVIINSIGELITNKLESEYLQEQFKKMGSEIFKQVSSMQELREIELEAQLHLMSLNTQNQIKTLQELNAFFLQIAAQEHKIKEEFRLESLRLENALLLEQKRKEALESGAIPQEQINQFSYKVV